MKKIKPGVELPAFILLKQLVDKLEEVHNSDEYKGVWSLYQLHFPEGYKGLQYAEEFQKAKKFLSQFEGKKHAGNSKNTTRSVSYKKDD